LLDLKLWILWRNLSQAPSLFSILRILDHGQ
jgi:hypothetical protein